MQGLPQMGSRPEVAICFTAKLELVEQHENVTNNLFYLELGLLERLEVIDVNEFVKRTCKMYTRFGKMYSLIVLSRLTFVELKQIN